MNLILQQKLEKDKKMAEFLKQNSYWYKQLNRNSNNYNLFVNSMKEKYHLRATDKLESIIDNIDLVSNVLNNFK